MKPASLRPFLPRPAIRRRLFSSSTRRYAVQTPGAPMLQVFNSNTKHLQRERAASDVEGSRKVDYLRDEVAVRLCERLLVSILIELRQWASIDLRFAGYKPSFPRGTRSWCQCLQYSSCFDYTFHHVRNSSNTLDTPNESDVRRSLSHASLPRCRPPLQQPAPISYSTSPSTR